MSAIPSFKTYAENIHSKWGKTPEDFWKLSKKMAFVKNNRIVAKHSELLKWLKSDIGLGHVYANMVITYPRARSNDPTLSPKSKNWLEATWPL
jgi:Domain of unknown function (DUF4287)